MKALRLLRVLGVCLRALAAHRTRSLLAVAGVAVGVAAVIEVAALGRGAEAQLLAGMSAQGAGLLVIRPAQVRPLVARRELRGRVTTLTPADGEAIATLPSVTRAAPVMDGPLRVRSEAGSARALVVGTTVAFPEVRSFALERGAFFSADDDRTAARVAVLGARARAALFPLGGAVGSEVRIGGAPFEVVGTLEPQGVSADGADVDTQVYVPLRTALRRVWNARGLGSVFVEVREGASPARAEAEIRALLRARHRLDERGRPDDFVVQDPARAVTARRQAARTVTRYTAGLAAISLLVGGTGILALMLLSVRERTSEIGVRRAFGARPRDVGLQFLAEATVLSTGGGLAGLVLGVLGAWATAAATGWPVRAPAWAVATGLGASALTGLASGVLPALRAARLPPALAVSR